MSHTHSTQGENNMSIDFIGSGGLGQIGTFQQNTVQGDQKTENAGAAEFTSSLEKANSTNEANSVQDAERAQKIAELKEQIQAGNYNPDTTQVANKLLDSVFAAGSSLLDGE